MQVCFQVPALAPLVHTGTVVVSGNLRGVCTTPTCRSAVVPETVANMSSPEYWSLKSQILFQFRVIDGETQNQAQMDMLSGSLMAGT